MRWPEALCAGRACPHIDGDDADHCCASGVLEPKAVMGIAIVECGDDIGMYWGGQHGHDQSKAHGYQRKEMWRARKRNRAVH